MIFGLPAHRIRSSPNEKTPTVFVVGAGFSAEFGYPTARLLLPGIWPKLSTRHREILEGIIRFHHPGWDGRRATLPDVEELLTELAANEDLLPSLRSRGGFTVNDLRRARKHLLLAIARWFHEIHSGKTNRHILGKAVERIKLRRAAIISFNWDYELDRALFKSIDASSYGLSKGSGVDPMILKPHGSLNWYPSRTGEHIREDLRLPLWKEEGAEVYCFLRWREPRSTRRRYLPWIVPPTHSKDFRHSMLKPQ